MPWIGLMDTLPVEIIYRIFSYIPTKYASKLCRTCTYFMEFYRSNYFWKQRYAIDFFMIDAKYLDRDEINWLSVYLDECDNYNKIKYICLDPTKLTMVDDIKRLSYPMINRIFPARKNITLLNMAKDASKIDFVAHRVRQILQNSPRTKIIICSRFSIVVGMLNIVLTRLDIPNVVLSYENMHNDTKDFNEPTLNTRILLTQPSKFFNGIILHDTNGNYPRHMIIMENGYSFLPQFVDKIINERSKSKSTVEIVGSKEVHDRDYGHSLTVANFTPENNIIFQHQLAYHDKIIQYVHFP